MSKTKIKVPGGSLVAEVKGDPLAYPGFYILFVADDGAETVLNMTEYDTGQQCLRLHNYGNGDQDEPSESFSYDNVQMIEPVTHQKSYQIAKDFLQRMNPYRWNGKGELPDVFDGEHFVSYDIGRSEVLYIQFEKDPDTGVWYHSCSLYNEPLGQTMETLSGNSIQWIGDLANTIYALCNPKQHQG